MKRPTHFSAPETPWGKPHTQHLYLQPPFAESLVTLRPNTMILLGEIGGGAYPQIEAPGRHDESEVPSSAMVFLYRNQIPDFKKGEFTARKDGIPIHSLRHNFGDYSMEMETFCNIERVPTAFTRLIIRNNTDRVLKDQFCFTGRTASEFDLLGVKEPDGYAPVEPSVNRWMTAPPWRFEEGKYTDDKYTILYQAEKGMTDIHGDRQRVYCLFELAPGGETEMRFAFSRARVDKDFSYEDEKKKTEAFWEAELNRIQVFPKKDDPEFYAMYRSFIAQGLQMFAYPQGVNYTIMRQGGLQRLMWPIENRSLIRAFTRIGDFDKYIDAIFNTYFHVMQAENGEVVNFGIPWGSVTGGALCSFGAVAMYNEKLYEKYKDNAYRAFRFIEEQRALSTKTPGLADGLFAPRRASDFAAVGQIWQQTDLWNVQGYAVYAEGLKRRGDEHAEEVIEAFWDYYGRLKAIVDRCAAEQPGKKKIYLQVDARFDPEIEAVAARGLHSKAFNDLETIATGLLGEDTPLARDMLEEMFVTEKNFENGLVGPYDVSFLAPEKGRRFYVSWVDMELYLYFRRNGYDEKAKEILDGQLAYSMTDEYYLGERIDTADGWWFPWSPNCSANGRTLSMLLDWYVSPEEFTFFDKNRFNK